MCTTLRIQNVCSDYFLRTFKVSCIVKHTKRPNFLVFSHNNPIMLLGRHHRDEFWEKKKTSIDKNQSKCPVIKNKSIFFVQTQAHSRNVKHNLNIRIIKVFVLQCDEPRKINTKSFLKWDVIIYNKIQIIHMNQFTYGYKFLLHVQVSKLGIQYTSTMLKTLMVSGGLLSIPLK